jgi:hypothetical protein
VAFALFLKTVKFSYDLNLGNTIVRARRTSRTAVGTDGVTFFLL